MALRDALKQNVVMYSSQREDDAGKDEDGSQVIAT